MAKKWSVARFSLSMLPSLSASAFTSSWAFYKHRKRMDRRECISEQNSSYTDLTTQHNYKLSPNIATCKQNVVVISYIVLINYFSKYTRIRVYRGVFSSVSHILIEKKHRHIFTTIKAQELFTVSRTNIYRKVYGPLPLKNHTQEKSCYVGHQQLVCTWSIYVKVLELKRALCQETNQVLSKRLRYVPQSLSVSGHCHQRNLLDCDCRYCNCRYCDRGSDQHSG